MKVTDILRREHSVILQVLEQMQILFTGARYGENTDEILRYINFIQEYADDFHHSKEEDIYFIWMKNKNPSLEHGPLMCMLSEHEQGRILVKNAKIALDNFKASNDANNLIEMKKNLMAFSQLLNNHINKENEVLYPMAESLNESALDGDELMLEKFIVIENSNLEILKKYKELGV